MKNKSYRSFRQEMVTGTLVSAAATIVFELILFYLLNNFGRYLGKRGYRSSFIIREGIKPSYLIIIMVILGICMFMICFQISIRRHMLYLEEISRGIQKISEGDLNAPMPIRGDNEFAKIALNLNAMTEEIKMLIAKERNAEISKNDLITSVAHDLRTPLTSIIGYLDLIRRKNNLDENTRMNYVEIAYTKAKRLEKLTNDLFGFTKLNHGEMTMNPGKLDIVKLMDQLLEEFYPSFEDKNLEYDFTSSHPSIIIEADGILLARLFDNLINNAIKYGVDGKMVRVSIHRKDTKVQISVINYGRVIPEHELENIFQKFYRVDQSRSLDTGGTGLGLAIAKSVVMMHGGDIEARSSLHGTVFEVHLPLSLNGVTRKFEE